MGLLTYQWQRPDVDSLVRLALQGQENERIAAIQQIEQQRLQQKQVADMALQLRQERRVSDAQKFREQLDTAKELRLTNAAGKYNPSPVFLPPGDGSNEPPLPTNPALPADSAPSDVTNPAFADSLLTATAAPTLADQVDPLNPAPFSFATGTQPEKIDPVLAESIHAGAIDDGNPAALLRSAPLVAGTDVSSEPPGNPSAFAPTDFAGMLRSTGGGMYTPSPGPAGAGAEGPPDSPATWANLRQQGGLAPWPVVPANAAGPGLSGVPDNSPARPVVGDVAGSLKAAASQLDSPARARVNAVASLEAAGQAKPGSSTVAFQKELASAQRLRDAQSKTAATKPIVRNFPDGTARQWNPQTSDWETVAEKPAAGAKPTVRNFSDGTTRQFDPTSNTWIVMSSKAEPQSIEEATSGLDYIAEHGTYRNPETGAESFFYKSGNKVNTRPFNPSLHPARSVPGTDGQIYFVDAQGEPVKPLPEGVQLGKFNAPKIHSVPGGGLVSVDRNGTPTIVLPPGVPMTTDDKKDYSAALKDVEEAKGKLADETALFRDKPRGADHWFGGSQSKIDEAKKDLGEKSKKAANFLEKYPQLKMTLQGGAQIPPMPGAAPVTPAAPGMDRASAISAARDAVHRGKDPVAVLARLHASGIPDASLADLSN